MLTILLRTLLVYIILVATMRLMGKRQLGELEISELISTLLISEIASLPIIEQDIPLMYAIIPLVTILTLEVVLSMILVKYPRLKNLASARPSILIRHGKLDQRELYRNRISLDELISEVRQAGLCTLEDVDYAIMEQNGRITVLPRKNAQPPTMRDLGMKGEESGILHVLIENGVINRYNLNLLGLDDRWLQAQLKRKKWRLQDVFLLGCDDTQRLYWIKREKKE